jgi:hypothetical protein
MDNRMLYYSASKKCLLIWNDVMNRKTVSFSRLKVGIMNIELDLSTPVNILERNIPFEQCALLIKLCVMLFRKHE